MKIVTFLLSEPYRDHTKEGTPQSATSNCPLSLEDPIGFNFTTIPCTLVKSIMITYHFSWGQIPVMFFLFLMGILINVSI